MFAHDEKIKAVQLYLKYESWSAVIRELGYPSVGALRQWVHEYTTNNCIREEVHRSPKYSDEQIQNAVNYYLTHGRNINKTVRDLGYPCRSYLKEWLIQYVPDFKFTCRIMKTMVHLTDNEKTKAVIELCAKEETAKAVASKYGVESMSLYNWKHALLGDKEVMPMPKKKQSILASDLQKEVNDLSQQADELRRQVYQLQLEKDVLKKAVCRI